MKSKLNNREPSSESESTSSSENEDEPINILEKLMQGPKRELNILLLGETGSGKSTTINALANYLLYASFNEATTGEFKQLIPSKFTLPDPVTGAPYEIQLGKDSNESQSKGNSSTQEPRGYVFPLGNATIRIIDTPGMGDTRGAKVDNENFEKILQHLTLYKELHGICILVKATETRKTNSFRYCINELLTYLHKDAVKNMVFLFTFSRNSFYGPGEGFSTLKSFLGEELKDAHIEMVSNGLHANCFFIDNEAFRYLVAKKTGYKFSSNQERSYRESWHTSVEQTMGMFNRFLTERPHTLESTLSLNHARKVILQLAEPLARLESKKSSNIKIITEKVASLKVLFQTKEALTKLLYIQMDDLKSYKMTKVYTVCTAAKCTKVFIVEGVRKVKYTAKCHAPCKLTNVETHQIGHPELQNCDMINCETGFCTQCNCSWQLHMQTNRNYYQVVKTKLDETKANEIANINLAIHNTDYSRQESKKLILEFEEEMKVIHDIVAFFACTLINNSISPYNRFLLAHLNMLIDEEEKKVNASEGTYSRNVKEELCEMLRTHQAHITAIKRAIDSNKGANDELKNIDRQLEQLMHMKHTGSDCIRIMQSFNKARLVIKKETIRQRKMANNRMPLIE